MQELHPCCCHASLALLAMGDSGTSTVLTRYKSMRLRSLCQSERTNASDPVQDKRKNYRAIGMSIQNINKDGRADGVRRLPNIWQKVIRGVATILKVHKCCTTVKKSISEIANCCHNFLPSLCSESV